MIKVLIIEDQTPHYTDIKSEFERHSMYFEVAPKLDDDTDKTLNNKNFLIDTLLKPNGEGFQSVIDHYQGIDLFIIDATLYQAQDDRVGIEFLNFLKKSNYRNNKFNFIITSQHNLDKIGSIEADFEAEKQYVSKNKWGNKFPEEIVRLSANIYNINLAPPQAAAKIYIKFWEKRWWIILPDIIEKHIIHRFNLLIFYVIIISTGIFAICGVTLDTYKLFCIMNAESAPIKSVNHLVEAPFKATKLLEYVEHIFLYLLPLFIIFSFISYYKSTIEIKLTGGNTRNIDHDGAIKSLNNSKLILLSSLLSFTIIKIIDKIFFEENSANPISLISYGVFLAVLMVFILFQHKRSK